MMAWFQDYFLAVEARDVETCIALFSEDATYEMVDPFEEWTSYGQFMRGRSEIKAGFEGFLRSMRGWDLFEHEVLSATADLGIAHVRQHWVNSDSGEEIRCDNIILVKLNSDNLCTSIRDWSRVRARG